MVFLKTEKLGTAPLLFLLCLTLFLFSPFSSQVLAAEDEPAFSDQQKSNIRDLIRQFILDNPKVILESVENMERQKEADRERRAQVAINDRSENIFNDSNSVVGGNPNGDVTLVEFFDYQCGYCKRVHPVVRQLLQEDQNIKFVYKEFPILGPASTYAAKAAIASIEQGKYLVFHDALMEVKGGLSEELVLKIASNVGLDPEKLSESIVDQNDKLNEIMQLNRNLAGDLAINGTPAFIIGNDIIRGAVGLDVLKRLVAEARASKKG